MGKDLRGKGVVLFSLSIWLKKKVHKKKVTFRYTTQVRDPRKRKQGDSVPE